MASGTSSSPRATLTACIIARDEAERLPACLASVAFCDEIVVVDSGSVDATVAIARAAGATVVEAPWRGFAAQRNIALDHAHGDWVLEIDADERVSPELRAEIERFLADPPAGVALCGLPLRDIFLGRPLGPSAKYPKYRHRLFRRDAFRHDESRTVHEGLVPRGTVHPFEGDLVHLLASSWREAIGDAWRYGRLETLQLAPAPPARAAVNALIRPAVKLAYRLIVGGGWRDGWRGLAKIALECGTDVVAWAGLLVGAPNRAGLPPARAADAETQAGASRRVVGIAYGSTAAAQGAAWLRAAAAAGADVALVTTAPGAVAHAGVRARRLDRGPFALARALDAEDQLRAIDVLVPFGRRARAALRLTPLALPEGDPVEADSRDDPARVAGGSDG